MGTSSSVRRILKRGGGGGQKFQKIWEEQRSESEVVPLKFSLIFRPNLGEEHKKKRSSLKFRPIFRPNLGEEQKKKKRSLLKVRPVFHPNSLKFPAKSLMPNLQSRGPCLNFAHFTMQFCNPSDPKGVAMAQWPPP